MKRQHQSKRTKIEFQSDVSNDRDESPEKRSKKHATPTGPAKDKTTPKSNSSNVTADRRITRRMSIEQMSPPSRNLRKRKVIEGNGISEEIENETELCDTLIE